MCVYNGGIANNFNSAMEHVFTIGNGIAVRLFCRMVDR